MVILKVGVVVVSIVIDDVTPDGEGNELFHHRRIQLIKTSWYNREPTLLENRRALQKRHRRGHTKSRGAAPSTDEDMQQARLVQGSAMVPCALPLRKAARWSPVLCSSSGATLVESLDGKAPAVQECQARE